ncbi:hypothetical protein ACLI09_07165 [Flavobacterium sp. RHBU_24]|uniref:hypothetical protein n=1 Tax=Flavobacterium sp. RHBU_24 TaxID=3391185 RepID=UPI0039851FF8
MFRFSKNYNRKIRGVKAIPSNLSLTQLYVPLYTSQQACFIPLCGTNRLNIDLGKKTRYPLYIKHLTPYFTKNHLPQCLPLFSTAVLAAVPIRIFSACSTEQLPSVQAVVLGCNFAVGLGYGV